MRISFCIVILYFQSTFDILRELASPILFHYTSIFHLDFQRAPKQHEATKIRNPSPVESSLVGVRRAAFC